MTNCHRNDISEYDDISTKDCIRLQLTRAHKRRSIGIFAMKTAGIMRAHRCRSADENGGFSAHAPWLADESEHKEINVSEQEEGRTLYFPIIKN